MTIAIGTISTHSIIIGTDSLWSWSEDFVRDHKTSKFIEAPNKLKSKVLVASAGQDRFTQIFERLIRKSPELLGFENREGALVLIEALQEEVGKHGIGDPDTNQLPEHNLSFLIGSAITKSLWTIEADYGINEFDDFVCIGSGTFIGESAMHVLAKHQIAGRVAVKSSLETAMALHPFCGGRTEIREITIA